MNQISYLQDLYQQASKDVTQNSEQWKSLLETMGRFYKRSFDNTVLLHVQNPNAVQIGTESEWAMDGISRTVKENAKGIAVIDTENPMVSLKYYFDLMDTAGSLESFQRVTSSLWKLEQRHQSAMLQSYNAKHGIQADRLESALYQVIQGQVDQYFKSNGIIYDTIQGKTGFNQQVIVDNLAKSIYYMVGTRIGLDCTDVEMQGIEKCNDFQVFTRLGLSIIAIGRPLLNEISVEIAKIKRSEENERANSKTNLHKELQRSSVPKFRNFPRRTQKTSGRDGGNLESISNGTQSRPHEPLSDGGNHQPENRGNGQEIGRHERSSDSATSEKESSTYDGGSTPRRIPHEKHLPPSQGVDLSNPEQLTTDLNVTPSSDSRDKLSLDGFFMPPPKIEAEEITPPVVSFPVPESPNKVEEVPPHPVTPVELKSEVVEKVTPPLETVQNMPSPSVNPVPAERTSNEVRTVKLSYLVSPYQAAKSDFVDKELPLYTDQTGKEFVLDVRADDTDLVVYNRLVQDSNNFFEELAIITGDGELYYNNIPIPPLAVQRIEDIKKQHVNYLSANGLLKPKVVEEPVQTSPEVLLQDVPVEEVPEEIIETDATNQEESVEEEPVQTSPEVLSQDLPVEEEPEVTETDGTIQDEPQEVSVVTTETDGTSQEEPVEEEPVQTSPEVLLQDLPVEEEPVQTSPEVLTQDLPVEEEPEVTDTDGTSQEEPVEEEPEVTETDGTSQEESVEEEPVQTSPEVLLQDLPVEEEPEEIIETDGTTNEEAQEATEKSTETDTTSQEEPVEEEPKETTDTDGTINEEAPEVATETDGTTKAEKKLHEFVDLRQFKVTKEQIFEEEEESYEEEIEQYNFFTEIEDDTTTMSNDMADGFIQAGVIAGFEIDSEDELEAEDNEREYPRYIVQETPESLIREDEIIEPYIILDQHYLDEDLDRYYHDDTTYYTYDSEADAQKVADKLNALVQSVDEVSTPEIPPDPIPTVETEPVTMKEKEETSVDDTKQPVNVPSTKTALEPEPKNHSFESQEIPHEQEKQKEILFFNDIDDIGGNFSDYKDRELIGYNREGVKYEILRTPTSYMFSETTSLGPRGEILGDAMDSDTYKKFCAWRKQQAEDATTASETTENPLTEVGESTLSTLPIPYKERTKPEDNTGNYRYQDSHNLYAGGAKTKFKANVEAIKTLKVLESEDRVATPEEQIKLANYVGWGGLANALTEKKVGWDAEYKEIKELLTEEEFKSALSSTVTAYYTEQMVVDKMYQVLKNAGFKRGSILDPAMGTGNFYSAIPEELNESKLYGVELDHISGRIARKLYPSADIELNGYEETSFPDQFFDVAIGNIPFNNIQINDGKYNRHNFMIHDYFIAKTFDKVRPNGIVAFITTKGTMDKKSQKERAYFAQRGELLGAIRLPNTAFRQVAGTQVTADILFFKKREKEIAPNNENTPWLSLGETEDGIPVNQYFVDHPEMLLGKMVYDESMYGSESTTSCHLEDGGDLERKLQIATGFLDFEYTEPKTYFATEENVKNSIEADPDVKNLSYTVVNDEIYFRDKSKMYPQDFTGKKAERVKGMVQIHEDLKALIDYQTNLFVRDSVSTEEYQTKLLELREKLNKDYDEFVKKYGYLNSSANVSVFKLDGAAPLIRSIEVPSKEDKSVFEKNAVFYKSTIEINREITKVSHGEEALMLSMNKRGRVDLDFMSSIYEDSQGNNVSKDDIILELEGRIFQDPDKREGNFDYGGYVLREEYLSGYVVDKLKTATFYEADNPEKFRKNVEALKEVQPIPLEAHEIDFRLGSTWIPVEVYQDFIYELCQTSQYNRGPQNIHLNYSHHGNRYHISNKNDENSKVNVVTVYGTARKNAYEIIEDTLNLKKTEVKDPVDYVSENGDKKKKYVLNRPETIVARAKQDQIENEFKNWLFKDPERCVRMVDLYNANFNDVVVRTYDGNKLDFPNLNPSIKLRTHQKNVIAKGLFSGGNLLMAHEVGAGKTYSAIVLAYEMKRLGLANKPLITVPNHLVGQWANSFMDLYPTANIMVASNNDVKAENRRKFTTRIATSDFDAIIMPHSSFELIGMSKEYQERMIEEEITEVSNAIQQAKMSRSEDPWGTKQLEIFKKNLEARLNKLLNSSKKDNIINFEELGVDALIVDESHLYKNNFSYTKLRVAGLNGNSSERAADMHMKAQYINKINDGRGVIYLTGTPVSNSLAELYVIQKTLQPQELARRNQTLFDNWVSAYGEVTAEMEIKPESNGWQTKERLSHFHNIPELMKMFRSVADIQTSEMLDEVPVPALKTGKPQIIEAEMTPEQKECMEELVEYADGIRSGDIKDNFLTVTRMARFLAIDPRKLKENLPNDPSTKLNLCANNVAKVFHETTEEKLTQIVFCDQGTPKKGSEFTFYQALKDGMVEQGVPSEQIAFIHDYEKEEEKETLFEQMRKGDLRILIGSTAKCGCGMNVQDLLIGVHHLDIPWKPSDLTQRNGRIIRQGNQNEEVSIFNYVTKGSFDSYLWQILEKKQKFISQIMRGDDTIRRCDELDETVLQFAEIKAVSMDNPKLKEKMDVDNLVTKLTLVKSSWQASRAGLERDVATNYPTKIIDTQHSIEKMKEDLKTFESKAPKSTEEFFIEIEGKGYEERAKAGEHLDILRNRVGSYIGDSVEVGNYADFRISIMCAGENNQKLLIKGKQQYSVEIGDSSQGAIQRLENLMKRIPEFLENAKQGLEDTKKQLEVAKVELSKTFPQEEELTMLQERKTQLDLELEFGAIDPLGVELYEKFSPYFESLLTGDVHYSEFASDGYEDLVVEIIGDGEYSIAHRYESNGDLMRDPEITFKIENKLLVPTSYLQDGMGIFYRCADVPEHQVKDLKEFMLTWGDNLNEQGFRPKEIEQQEDLEK